ncbi:PSD1 and planctomycete cytochrome C domain-containing protein [Planctomicrobium sp. SH668]|uniref:PSD1 and planctomycete cytochrome C domain-containing protein n=1 Tax=Planctomicrobium sp. SH668 TaxID=3448126 RepID=UPI003F5AEE0E
MMNKRLSWFIARFSSLVVGAFFGCEAIRADDAHSPEDLKFFEEKIRPVLVAHCYECHAGDSKIVRGNLFLDSRDGIRKGGDSGPSVVPGMSEESLILDALKHETFEMPPREKLPDEVIADFEKWIQNGAVDPRDQGQGEIKKRDLEEERKHWSFQPIREPELPSVKDESWGRNPIDTFILANLEAQNLKPSPQAEKEVLLRRVTFDLTGLPPTRDEVEAFLADTSPEAYSNVVDRLLASPKYGERWARHWLDLVRYADSNGADENHSHTVAWRYRDWVIEQFNKDLPFDQFIIQQLAGDLLPQPGNEKEAGDLIRATGMLVLGPKMLAEQDKEKMVIDIVDEQLDTVSRTILGLTVACARCHDHKFDPISAHDYYALAGIFASTRSLEHKDFVSQWMERPLPSAEIEQKRAEILPQIAEAKEEMIRREQALKEATDENRESLQKSSDEQKAAVEQLEKSLPAFHRTMAVEEGQPHDLPIHIRGSHLTLAKETTSRGVPNVLTQAAPFSGIPANVSGRLELAEWLVSPENPLTARVMVNRVWQWYFGEAIVRSPSNFGLMGLKPTHPELLDWLAIEFYRNGKSFKALHKTILLSSTYQMSSQASPVAASFDPDNLHWSHQNKRRLGAEQLRDAIIAVGNDLDQTFGGEGVGGESKRRSIYLRVDRSNTFELFTIFDLVETGSHIEQRPSTIVPHQALFLMNNPFVLDESRKFAAIICQSSTSSEERMTELYLTMLGRSPSEAEAEITREFLRKVEAAKGVSSDSPQVWETLALAMFASNEFVFLD